MRGCPHCGLSYTSWSEHCGLDGTALVELDDHLLVDRRIGHYRVVETIGMGGVAVVYRATHEVLGTDVAMKVLLGEMACRPLTEERFRREAQAMSKILHPNVVRTLDYGTSQQRVSYQVMELIQGRTLYTAIDEGDMGLDRVRAIASDVARGLSAAHASGFVHRDLKPSNIMLVEEGGREVAKILDFGLVGFSDQSRDLKLTQTGVVLGTPHYMAPEALSLQGTTAASDLYSFGITLYEMIEGRVPFPGDSFHQIMHAHVSLRAPAMKRAGALEPLVMQLLEKRPEDRPASADEVLARLSRRPSTLIKPAVIAAPILFLSALVALALSVDPPKPTIEAMPIVEVAAIEPSPPPEPPPPRVEPPVVEPKKRRARPASRAPVAIEVLIESQPSGATVRLKNGGTLGRTPMTAILDGNRPAELILESATGAQKHVKWRPGRTRVRVQLD